MQSKRFAQTSSLLVPNDRWAMLLRNAQTKARIAKIILCDKDQQMPVPRANASVVNSGEVLRTSKMRGWK